MIDRIINEVIDECVNKKFICKEVIIDGRRYKGDFLFDRKNKILFLEKENKNVPLFNSRS